MSPGGCGAPTYQPLSKETREFTVLFCLHPLPEEMWQVHHVSSSLYSGGPMLIVKCLLPNYWLLAKSINDLTGSRIFHMTDKRLEYTIRAVPLMLDCWQT